MISTNDMRAGQAIIYEGKICVITEYNRVKPGKGASIAKVKLKDLITGQVFDHSWKGEDKVEQAILAKRPFTFLYKQGGMFHFMDTENYDQIAVSRELVEHGEEWLKENMEVLITFHNDKPVVVDVPQFVELKVTETAPGVRGDTVSGATKEATLETGAIVQVPLFINIGDVLKIDTRTGDYVTRA
jgi:elongation factor P